METITVWTKQHQDVWTNLERDGRHVASRAGIRRDLGEEDASLVLAVYDWLADRLPTEGKPADAVYPVWVSRSGDAAMLPGPGFVILELQVDPGLITDVNIAKWGAILNYSYIPADEADARRHRKRMEAHGVSDAKAFMSRFYPELKEEIVQSWDRLFDDSVQLGNSSAYGVLWEIRREWVKCATR